MKLLLPLFALLLVSAVATLAWGVFGAAPELAAGLDAAVDLDPFPTDEFVAPSAGDGAVPVGPAEPPGEPVAQEPAGRDPFGLPEHVVPVVDGPLLEAFFSSGQPEFRGTQVRRPEGDWVREGDWTAWHENGQVHELGAYANGVEHGEWQWWYEDGQQMAIGRWVDGAREGPWTFWRENGRVGMEGHYTGGVGDGVWTLYHEDGYRWAQGPYVDGEISGFWTVWNEDGSVNEERTGRFEGGKKVE